MYAPSHFGMSYISSNSSSVTPCCRGGTLLKHILLDPSLKSALEIFALVRSDSHVEAVKSMGIKPLQMDMMNEEAVRKAVIDNESMCLPSYSLLLAVECRSLSAHMVLILVLCSHLRHPYCFVLRVCTRQSNDRRSRRRQAEDRKGRPLHCRKYLIQCHNLISISCCQLTCLGSFICRPLVRKHSLHKQVYQLSPKELSRMRVLCMRSRRSTRRSSRCCRRHVFLTLGNLLKSHSKYNAHWLWVW